MNSPKKEEQQHTHYVEYKKLTNGDEANFADLVLLFNMEFESPQPTFINSKNIKRLLENDNFVCFVAHIGNQIVGGLTAYELEMYDQEGSAMYIYDVAVSQQYQRMGIGSRLIKEILADCKEKSINDVFVQADADDHHAVEFYKKNGGLPSKAYQFSFHTSDS